jgi:hypothetical protein
MLLSNRWFGPALRRWEEHKTLSRKTKTTATTLIVVSFSVSIALLVGRVYLQIMLVVIAIMLLFFIWRIKEE